MEFACSQLHSAISSTRQFNFTSHSELSTFDTVIGLPASTLIVKESSVYACSLKNCCRPTNQGCGHTFASSKYSRKRSITRLRLLLTFLILSSIRVVFKWLMRAFSGHLQPLELLTLWDLILGYDSLEILSLLAIIILSFRKESLMQVSSIESVEAVLADLSSIKVLPLIQLALSRD
jgi:hypothetical protein